MKLKQILAPAGACLLMAGLASALPATAADWAVWKGQDEAAPRAIYTTGAETAGAVLTCDGKGLMSAMLSMEPASMPDLLQRNAPYARGTDANVTVGDHEPVQARFQYVPARKMLTTTSHAVAGRVFNAAVTGEPVTVETRHEGTAHADLPAPNDSFRAFAKTCMALREASRS